VEFDEFAETTAFRSVVRIITALSVSDDRIVEELRAIHNGKVSRGKIIKIEGTVPVGMHMALEQFADAVSVKIWEKVARISHRPFVEARSFAQSLGLTGKEMWAEYCKSSNKPIDIPSTPRTVYCDEWIGWNDWLGTKPQIPEGGTGRSQTQRHSFRVWALHPKKIGKSIVNRVTSLMTFRPTRKPYTTNGSIGPTGLVQGESLG
jgi:hypothetical protein